MTGGKALSGLRIIDLTQALAGPYCTSMLADHGADVLKIEPPHGDMIRNIGPFTEDDDLHAYGGVFQNANRNKRSMVLDLKVAAAREVLLELVDGADALVENFSAGVMERFGLGYDVLSARNPKLVYTSIRGFGDKSGGESPYSNWPAFDIVAQAMGGLMGITGPDEKTRVRVGSGIGDTVPGLFGAFGTMVALFEAQRSGKGQYVDIAMVDSVLAISEVAVNNYSYTGTSPVPIGNQLRGFAPFDTVEAKDGTVALGAPHRPQWVKLCTAMGRADLIDDPRFANDHDRWTNREQVYSVLNAWVAQYTVAELMKMLGGKVPLGPIFSAADIFADPHFAARGMLPTVDHPGSSHKVAVTGPVTKLSRTPASVETRAPLLGEHTLEVLHELGHSAPAMDELELAGAIVLPKTIQGAA